MPGDDTALLDWEVRGSIHIGTIRSNNVFADNMLRDFRQNILAYVAAHPKVNLLLDFQNVTYIPSTALADLIVVRTATNEGKGHLRLCGVSDTIREIFKITNLADKFIINREGAEIDLPRFEKQLEVEAEENKWNSPA